MLGIQNRRCFSQAPLGVVAPSIIRTCSKELIPTTVMSFLQGYTANAIDFKVALLSNAPLVRAGLMPALQLERATLLKWCLR